MNKLLGWGGLAVLVAGLATFGIIWNASAKIPHGFYEPSAFVRLEADNGLGSGVHIGNGLVLTAAHVVDGHATMRVVADDNRLVDAKAEVLWANKKYDIALVRVAKPQMAAAPLSCAKNFVGQHVSAYGNPMGIAFVHTSGEVVGAARPQGPWQSVIPIDATLIYGQSGGGVVDDSGNIVGITVGLMATPGGIAAFGFVVPAEVVCGLMGRS